MKKLEDINIKELQRECELNELKRIRELKEHAVEYVDDNLEKNIRDGIFQERDYFSQMISDVIAKEYEKRGLWAKKENFIVQDFYSREGYNIYFRNIKKHKLKFALKRISIPIIIAFAIYVFCIFPYN